MSKSPDFPRSQVTVKELAEAMGLTVFAIHHHIRHGNIRAEKVGGAYFIERRTARKILASYRRHKHWS